MRKGIFKKSVALMLAATMMISMAGCGKSGDGSKKSGGNDESADTKDMVYASEDLVLEGLQGDPGSIIIEGDKMYISTYEWIEGKASKDDADNEDSAEEAGSDTESEDAAGSDEEADEKEAVTESGEDNTESSEEVDEETSEEKGDNTEAEGDDEQAADDSEEEIEKDGTSIERMYMADLDGSNLQEIKLPEMDKDEYMNQMFVRPDGTYAFLYSSYDEKKDTSLFYIVQADENGKVTAKEDITKTLNLGNESYFSKVLMDDKDNLVFILESGVSVLSLDGKLVCELKAENNVWLEGAAKTKDGQIIVGYSGEEKASIQTVDLDSKKWGEPIELDIRYFNGGDSLMNGSDDYDFYYKDDSGIYGYTLADKKATKILDYMASDISSENTYNMISYTDGRFLSNAWDENGSKLVVYSKVDPSTIKDKQTITLTMLYLDDQVKQAAMDFNKNNKQYRIEIKDYSNEEDPETKMNADIIAGNVGDILCFGYLPVEQYAAKGLLEDLTPYFEKDDEVNPDDIVDSLREAITIDGKLYYVVPSFSISTLTASTKDVGKEMGWTFDDMKKLLEEKGEGARPFYSENKTDMLYSFAGNATTDFVDWTTGECSFDSQDFKDILEICNKGTNEETEYDENGPSKPTLIQEGKVLFNEGSVSLDEIQLYKAMFKDGLTFIGYPDAEKQGSYFSLDTTLGIYSKSDLKDGAWEFIKTFMSKEYQGKQVSTGNVWSTPSRKDALALKNEIAMATKKFTDEYGNEHEPVDSSWGWDDLEVKIGPSSQEDVDLYMELIDNTKKIGGWNQAILDIIIEECKSYFAGDKSVDETADIIQNRVKTYVNENR